MEGEICEPLFLENFSILRQIYKCVCFCDHLINHVNGDYSVSAVGNYYRFEHDSTITVSWVLFDSLNQPQAPEQHSNAQQRNQLRFDWGILSCDHSTPQRASRLLQVFWMGIHSYQAVTVRWETQVACDRMNRKTWNALEQKTRLLVPTFALTLRSLRAISDRDIRQPLPTNIYKYSLSQLTVNYTYTVLPYKWGQRQQPFIAKMAFRIVGAISIPFVVSFRSGASYIIRVHAGKEIRRLEELEK